MNDDDLLDLATGALRDEPTAAPVDPALTLRRIQSSVAQKNRRTLRTRAFLLPIAATLATSTAFAAATGKLTPVIRAVEVVFHPSTKEPPPAPPVKAKAAPQKPVPAPVMESAPPAAVESASPVEPSEIAPPPQPSPSASAGGSYASTGTKAPPPPASHAVSSPSPSGRAPSRESATRSAAPTPPSINPAPDPAPALNPAPAPDPTPAPIAAPASAAPVAAPAPPAPADPTDDLYLRAHRLHFGKAAPGATLASWDAYLQAAPNGRFAPEARFNRALVLIKLDRRPEAAAALAPFANGTFGTYRRDEARALLEALRQPR